MDDKVIIITGGADGIGAACVDVFLNEGAMVVAIDMNKQSLENLSEKYSPKYFHKIYAFQCDVSNYKNLKNAVDIIIKKFGRIDCIINNAGVHPPVTSIEDFSVDSFVKNLNINLVSNYALCQYAVPELRKTNGTIICITSMVAIVGQDKAAAYCASKSGQIGLVKALAIELAPNIRVNGIAPSNVKTTSMVNWLNTFDDPVAAEKTIAEVQVLQRMAEPKEIANIAFFLASDKSSFITGQIIQADGGACLDY